MRIFLTTDPPSLRFGEAGGTGGHGLWPGLGMASGIWRLEDGWGKGARSYKLPRL